jgi:hypothetical protein
MDSNFESPFSSFLVNAVLRVIVTSLLLVVAYFVIKFLSKFIAILFRLGAMTLFSLYLHHHGKHTCSIMLLTKLKLYHFETSEEKNLAM